MLEDALSVLESHLKGNPLVVDYHRQIVALLGNAKNYERYIVFLHFHNQLIFLRIIAHYEKYKHLFKENAPKWWMSFDEVWRTIGPYDLLPPPSLSSMSQLIYRDNKGKFGKSLFEWLDVCLDTVEQILASSKQLKYVVKK